MNERTPSVLQAIGENKTMAEVIFERLKWEIVTGHLQPGERLVERELTERFQVSRTPMREALKQLVRTQLATDIPYRGVFVRTLGYDFARDLYDLRFGIEGSAAFLAAKRATEGDLEELQQVFGQIDAAADAGDRDRSLVLNADFHIAIARATQNLLLVERIEELWTHISVVRGSAWVGNTRTDASRSEHRQILEALLARDSVGARSAMERHIQTSWRVVESALRRQEERQAEASADPEKGDGKG